MGSFICPSPSSRMKLFVIVAVLLSLGLAQDQPRYSCPEEFVTFRGDTISSITGVLSWEDCGTICNLSTDCRFWSWAATGPETLKCNLKDSDDGLEQLGDWISGENGCPPTNDEL